MNITFLIGNGFDRNLGLNTTYADFVKEYKCTRGRSETLKNFRSYIDENEKLWSAAEIALGQYTKEFDDGAAKSFAECQADFCEHLASYLEEQEKRVDYEASAEVICSAFSHLNNLLQSFPEQERNVLQGVYNTHNTETTIFQFINYNYTGTLENCLAIVKRDGKTLGYHTYGSNRFSHNVGKVCHVHGTIKKDMVFGVNDVSQIAKPEIFDCENGDLYKNLLIKQQANASYLENTDAKAAKLIQDSHLIYIYGMSIGETDKLWWDRICGWLAASEGHHLLIQKHSVPKKGVIPLDYQLFERKLRSEFSQYGNLEEEKRKLIEKKIHVTDENIFDAIKDIAAPRIIPSESVKDEVEKVPAGAL